MGTYVYIGDPSGEQFKFPFPGERTMCCSSLEETIPWILHLSVKERWRTKSQHVFCFLSRSFPIRSPLASAFLYSSWDWEDIHICKNCIILHSKCLILESHLILQIPEFQSFVVQLSFHLAFWYTGEGTDYSNPITDWSCICERAFFHNGRKTKSIISVTSFPIGYYAVINSRAKVKAPL